MGMSNPTVHLGSRPTPSRSGYATQTMGRQVWFVRGPLYGTAGHSCHAGSHHTPGAEPSRWQAPRSHRWDVMARYTRDTTVQSEPRPRRDCGLSREPPPPTAACTGRTPGSRTTDAPAGQGCRSKLDSPPHCLPRPSNGDEWQKADAPSLSTSLPRCKNCLQLIVQPMLSTFCCLQSWQSPLLPGLAYGTGACSTARPPDKIATADL